MKYFNYFFFATLVSLTPAAFAMNGNGDDGDKKQELDDIEMKDIKNNKRKTKDANLNIATDEPEKKKRKVLKLEYKTNPVVNNSNLDLDLYGDVLESNNNININAIVVQPKVTSHNQELLVTQQINNEKDKNKQILKDDESEKICYICREILNNSNQITLPCSTKCAHANVHFTCIKDWFQSRVDEGYETTCSNCQTAISQDFLKQTLGVDYSKQINLIPRQEALEPIGLLGFLREGLLAHPGFLIYVCFILVRTTRILVSISDMNPLEALMTYTIILISSLPLDMITRYIDRVIQENRQRNPMRTDVMVLIFLILHLKHIYRLCTL